MVGADTPYLAYLYPAGGQQGTTVAVTLAGERLTDTQSILISGTGVTARIVTAPSPPVDAAGKTKKRNQTVMEEVGQIELTIAADAAPGLRSLRLVTSRGPSPPRRFRIGTLPEQTEPVTTPMPKSEQPVPARPPVAVSLPVTMNGQLLPGEVDRYNFSGAVGTRLVALVAARSLIPFIADAVPGWCQSELALLDAQGRELAASQAGALSQDAVLVATLPADATYTLAVRDVLWRGRPDFVYRVSLGALPLVTGIAPLGATCGSALVPIQLHGENLPEAPTLIVDVVPGLRWLTLAPELEPWPFAITAPGWIDGCIATPGMICSFPYVGSANAVLTAEVRARRLGSRLDARLTVVAPDGSIVASADDTPDRSAGALTHQADPELTCTLPVDGTYQIRIADVLGRGSPDHGFRLRIGAPQPEAQVIAVPSSLAIPPGGQAQVTLHVLRRGCAEAIDVELEDGDGLVLHGGRIPAGAERAYLTLGIPAGALAAVIRPRLRAAGRDVVWADHLMQAFLWKHLVPDADPVAVVLAAPAPVQVVPEVAEVALQAGRETSIPVRVVRQAGMDHEVRMRLIDPPAGVKLRGGRIKAGADRGVLEVSLAAGSAPPAGNLIVEAAITVELPPAADGAKRKQTYATMLPALPVR